MVTEQMALEHGADLRREAVAYRRTTRTASRADRCEPGLVSRVSAVLHRRPAVTGCTA